MRKKNKSYIAERRNKMTERTKYMFMWHTHNGSRTLTSDLYDFWDDEFENAMEFVSKYYGVKCYPCVIEI